MQWRSWVLAFAVVTAPVVAQVPFDLMLVEPAPGAMFAEPLAIRSHRAVRCDALQAALRGSCARASARAFLRLIALDAFEQRTEVSGAEAAIAFALDRSPAT